MPTPQEVWDTFGKIKDQDMLPYRGFLRNMSGTILEVGVCAGVSTAAFLLGFEDRGCQPLDHLYSIDIDRACGKIFSSPQWTFIEGESQLVTLPPIEFDVVLIDGDHSYDAVWGDLDRFSDVLRPGGILLAHDVQVEPRLREEAEKWFDVDGCARAWEEFLMTHRGNWTILRDMTGMGVWEKPKC